ncbi:MAG: hypothetical protein LBU73_05320 [Helicobacteraceae bacterium]|jgi:Sec-independent protein secretion pathway component TatC|nr:hypothetical protein [Helicobacteraceae bacterium]
MQIPKQVQIPISKGIAALALAWVGLSFCFWLAIPLGLSIAGYILATIAMKEAEQAEDKQEKKIALAARIISGVTFVIVVILILRILLIWLGLVVVF